MRNKQQDKIIYLKDKILHQAAGGFVFYKSHLGEIYVALLKTKNGQFVVPKGHIQKDETPEAAALREIKEELGIKSYLKLLGYAGQSRYRFQKSKEKRIQFKKVDLFVFLCPKMVKLTPEKEEGFVEAKWVKVEEAERRLTFNKKIFRKAVEIYNQSI